MQGYRTGSLHSLSKQGFVVNLQDGQDGTQPTLVKVPATNGSSSSVLASNAFANGADLCHRFE